MTRNSNLTDFSELEREGELDLEYASRHQCSRRSRVVGAVSKIWQGVQE
jgi:hypothetical protein